MSAAAETVKIVFTGAVCMPEIQECACYRFSASVQDKSSQIDWFSTHLWFSKVILERRTGFKKRTGRFFRCQFQLDTCCRRRLQFDAADLVSEAGLTRARKATGAIATDDRVKESPPRQGR